MATLLNAVTADTVGALQTHSGPCTVHVSGTPGSARVVIQMSPTTNTTDVSKIDQGPVPFGRFDGRTGSVTVDAQGTYSLRAVLENADANTSITVTTTQ